MKNSLRMILANVIFLSFIPIALSMEQEAPPPFNGSDWKVQPASSLLSKQKPIFEGNKNIAFGDIVPDETYIKIQMKDYVFNQLKPNHEPSNIIILDIGGGRGHNTLPYLKDATVILNDLSKESLVYAAHEAPEAYRDRLWLTDARFPGECDFPPNSLDIVVFFHVAHYTPGEEIGEGFDKFLTWLKPGGPVYFTALSPWSLPFFFTQEEEERRFNNNDPFPGYFDNLTAVYNRSAFANLNKQIYAKLKELNREPYPNMVPENPSEEHHPYNPHMPNIGHPLRVSTLENLAKQKNFNILCANYFGINKNFPPSWPSEERLKIGFNLLGKSSPITEPAFLKERQDFENTLSELGISCEKEYWLFSPNSFLSSIGLILEKPMLANK